MRRRGGEGEGEEWNGGRGEGRRATRGGAKEEWTKEWNQVEQGPEDGSCKQEGRVEEGRDGTGRMGGNIFKRRRERG